MGEHDSGDAVLVLLQVGVVGDHEVDPEHVVLWELRADVDDEDAPIALENGHVLADLADSAEEGQPDGRCVAHVCSSR